MEAILGFRAADVLGGADAGSTEPSYLSEHRYIDLVRDRGRQAVVFGLARDDRPRFAARGASLAPAERADKGDTQGVVFENAVEQRAYARAVAIYRAVEDIGPLAVARHDPKRRGGSSRTLDVPHVNLVGGNFTRHIFRGA